MGTLAQPSLKKVFILLFLLVLPILLRCQDSVSLPKQIIKFSPLHLLNEFPTIQFAYEHRIGKKVSVQLDAGYVLNYSDAGYAFGYSPNREKSELRGFKLKEELRYYYKLKSYNRKSFNYSKASYCAVEFFQKIINYEQQYRESGCYEADCEIPFTVKLREPGVNLKIGFTEYLSRFMLDFSAGLSFRRMRYKQAYPYVEDYTDLLGFIFFINPPEKNQNIVTPVLGFRAGYRVGK